MYKLFLMDVKDAVEHYGTLQKVADALGLKRASAVANWNARYCGIVPELYARKLHDITRGRLKFEPDRYGEKV